MLPVYKLATVSYKGHIFPVIKVGDWLYDINQAYESYKKRVGYRDLFKAKHQYTMKDILEEWEIFTKILDDLATYLTPENGREFSYQENHISFKPPVFYPDKILNAGSNYYDHALEMGAAEPVKEGHEPYFFYKGRSHTIIGHNEKVHLTPRSDYIDWEAELAIVIGKTAKNVSVEEAYDYIAGYTCYNDISARDRMRRHDETFDYDWFCNKGNDSFGPLGPYITPSKFVNNPNNLKIALWLNGKQMQDTNTNQMVWDVAELVSTASKTTTLSPGDIIGSGTGSGVGMGKGITVKHGEIDKVFEHMYAGGSIMIKDGDYMRIEIEDVCVLENDVVA